MITSCFPLDKEAPAKGRVRRKKLKQEDVTDDHPTPLISDPIAVGTSDIIADDGDSPGDITSESDTEESDDDDNSSSSTDLDDFTFDLTASLSEGVVHGWGEVARDGRVPHSEETSCRLAVCNMDWDRLSANDIFGE